MIFERDKKHCSLYETPYGTMTLDIVTRTLRADLDETAANWKSATPSKSSTK